MCFLIWARRFRAINSKNRLVNVSGIVKMSPFNKILHPHKATRRLLKPLCQNVEVVSAFSLEKNRDLWSSSNKSVREIYARDSRIVQMFFN